MTFIRPLLICSALLAISFDLLLHDVIVKAAPIGISLTLMMSLSIAALIFLSVRTKLPGRRRSLYFLIPAFLLAIGCAYRDSQTLVTLDCFLIIFFLYLSSTSMQGCKMLLAGISRYIQVFICMFDSVMIQPVNLFFYQLKWNNLLPDNISTKAKAVLKGIMISLPLLFSFGLLLTSADSAYCELIRRGFQFDLVTASSHIMVLSLALWCSTGSLVSMFNNRLQSKDLSLDDLPSFELGAIEVCTIIGVVNLLFVTFVILQVQYLFGGESAIALAKGLTYAEYARRGFFELVAVVFLVLPILLFLDWSFVQKSPLSILIFRGLTLTQICMLFVMMASALKRMGLYQIEFGQTELRFYTTAFMGLMALVFVIYTLTVLRGYRGHFAFVSMMAGLLVTGVLHFLNPDKLIVSSNIDRVKNAKSFDIDYNLSLSKDAVPVLVSRMNELKKEDQARVKARLEASYTYASTFCKFKDWRYWNWSRAKADHCLGKVMRQSIGMNYCPDKPKIEPATGKI